jgi:hypothetical protein
MKRTVSLVLMWSLTGAGPTVLGAQTQAPGVVTGTVRQVTGVISGSVTLSAGTEPKDGTRIYLVDSSGVVVFKTQTKDGDFSMPGIALDTYTLQCVHDNGDVFGTEPVTLAATSAMVKMVCASDVVGWWRKWGLLTGLGAAATAIGAAAVVATTGDASGAR